MSIRALLFVTIVCIAGTAGAAIIDLKADGTGAYPTIQAAINAAGAGDEIVLAPGTYVGAGNRDIDFKGKAVTLRGSSPDDPAVITTTVLDCQNAGRGILFATGETATSVVEGLTIQNGRTDGDGGGIACHVASPTIRKCRILSCSAGTAAVAGAGGGISLDSSSATVSQCIIMNNSAWLGGGVYCGAGAAKVLSCVIAANATIATAGSADSFGGGAGIAFVSAAATVAHCTVVGNTSAHSRGGLYVFLGASPAAIRNCIVWGNAGSEVEGTGLVVSYCDVEGGVAGTGNLNSNPGLTADYHLPMTSPCVDTGDPAYLPAVDEADIDWQARVINGRADMGADEWTYVGDLDYDGHVDVVDLLTFAAAWSTFRGDAAYSPRCDFDSDGSIDVTDLLTFAENWGN